MNLRSRLGEKRHLPAVALCVLVVLAYLPSLFGGFLNYDDPWLIENNLIYRERTLAAVARIWLSLDFESRMGLGAEYLPVRDMSHWIEVQLFGVSAGKMRAVQLLIYLGSVLLMRGALLRSWGKGLGVELAAYVYALHPVHVESVAWLAGRKDVLALFFISAALYSFAGQARSRVVVVPFLIVLASLSKSMAVAAPSLFVVVDLAQRRRPPWAIYACTFAALLGCLVLHLGVGRTVSMVAEPLGGSRWTAFLSMGVVVLRYLVLLVDPTRLSIVHEVDVLRSWTLLSFAGWSVFFGWAVWGLLSFINKRRVFALATWICCFAPLLPVSQIFFPLQNVMTDRYLFLAVLCPALFAGALVRALPRIGWLVAAPVVGFFFLFTMLRAHTFSDSVLLFTDAMDHASRSPLAPYQLAQAYESKGDLGVAEDLYREALRRERAGSEPARRSTNNLAKLVARRGALSEAEEILRRGRKLWPDDPKIAGNLMEIRARQGQDEEARTMCRGFLSEFEKGTTARERCHKRYGIGE